MHLVDLLHQLVLQHHAGRLDVLGDLLGAAGADDRRGDVGVLQHPGDRELGEAQAGLVGERLQPLHPLEDVVAQPAADHVRAALVVGGARALRWLLARLVLAGERALRDRRPDDLADAELLAGRDDLLLDDPPQHVVLRLVGDQGDVQLAGERVRAADVLGPPLRDADVERLAGVHDVGEGLHRLLERGLVVVAVRLVEVDVVGAEPAQRPVDRGHDVLARQPVVVVPAGAGRPVDLREDLAARRGAPPPAPCRARSRPSCRRRRRRCRTS